MNEKRVLTGDRPTGKLHLGHYVGSLQNRIMLQNRDDIESRMYMVADVQALTDNYDNPGKVRENVLQVVLDNMACGLDPAKTTMFIQSMVPEIAELTVFFLNLVTVNRLLENPTVKTEILTKGWNSVKLYTGGLAATDDDAVGVLLGSGLFEDVDKNKSVDELTEEFRKRLSARPGVPAGFLTYPVSQAADILFSRANLIPVGADQRPMIEQANEIASAFNRIYNTDLFPHVDIMVGEIPRLVGIDGNAKMSKSLGNVIYLSSTRDEIAAQVRAAYTCPSKVRIEDIVSLDELSKNVVFQYLDIFDTDKDFVSDLKERYRTGKTGDVEGKNRLTEILDALISPIRERRRELESDLASIESILKMGIEKARQDAAGTMAQVRKVMMIDYFN